MLIRRISSFVVVVLSFAICAALISCKPAENAAVPAQVASIAAPLGVARDLDARLAKFKAMEMPLNCAFAQVSDIPVDIRPIYSFPEEIR